jgi:hypothetical protein
VAVAFDAVGPSSAGASATGAASLTWSHTNGGTANAIVAGGAVGKGADGGLTITATYAGTTMTPGTIRHSGGATAGFLRVFTLLNPTTGANNCVVTLNTSTADLIGGSVSMTGAGSFVAEYAADSGGVNQTTATATSAGSSSGGLICAFVCTGSGVTSATAPSTSRYIKNLNFSSAAGNAAGATSPSTGSNVTTAWTISSDFWAVIGVETLQAAAAAALPILVAPPPSRS